MTDLFEPVSRDDRQKECVNKWLKNQGIGTIEACTGFGKTKVGMDCIKLLYNKAPQIQVLVIVPTEGLQKQWNEKIGDEGLQLNVKVEVINTAITYNHACHLLIIDEIHRAAANTFIQIFSKVKYKYILGLTATLERLDGKHELISKCCPVIDSVPLSLALVNGWVAKYTEYKVILDVDDIDTYKNLNKQFNEHCEFFDYDFELIKTLVGTNGFINRSNLAKKLTNDKESYNVALKAISYHASGYMKTLQLRKKFINEHPEKIRLTREIIKHRPNCKIITFSASTKIAESIGIGYVYTTKNSTKKKNRIELENFSKLETGVLNTVKKGDEGLDIPGLSVAIILGMDSSPTRKTQRVGRVIRKEGNKVAEVFTFIINNTVESKWDENNSKNNTAIKIDAKNLINVLEGKPYETYKKPIPKMIFRF